MAGIAALGAFTKTIGTIATVASTAVGVVGQISSSRAQAAQQEQQAVATAQQQEYQAKVADMNADAAVASGQRVAHARYRQGREIASRQQAIAAASGGGDDISVLDIMGDTAEETSLAARTDLFNAEQQARGFTDQAAVSRVNAQNALTTGFETARSTRGAGVLGSIGAGLAGTTAMFDRFGRQNQTQSTGTSYRYG